jgi:adenylate kinase family enzyme
MIADEAFKYIEIEHPRLVHVTGKTSTGKTTFANRLKNELGYDVIELDRLATEAVIKPLRLTGRGHIMFELYKQRNELKWIGLLVAAARQKIQRNMDENRPAVLDGAVSNLATLQEILIPFPGAEILYFHPVTLETYKQFLTKRFMQTAADYQAGLPITFWKLVDSSEFRKFCHDRVLTPELAKAIETYAIASQHESEIRLDKFRKHFKNIKVIDI